MSELHDEYLLGSAASLRNDFETAIAAFEGILQRDPSSVDALLGLLDALVRVDRLDDAERVAQQLLAQEPADSGVFVGVARLRERQRRVDDAAELLQRANIGQDLAAYTLYLRVLIEQERFTEALLEAERGLEWELARPSALLAKGLSLLYFGDTAGAARTLDELDPEGFDNLLANWAAGLRAAGKADVVQHLVEPILQGQRPSATAAALARKLSEAG